MDKWKIVRNTTKFSNMVGALKKKNNGVSPETDNIAQRIREMNMTIHQAAREGLVSVVVSQVKERPHMINKADVNHMTPLHYASQSNNGNMIQELIARGADVSKKNRNGLSPLHFSAKLNYFDCVQVLLKHGADVNCTDDKGMSPLQYASRKGHYETVQVLLKFSASVNCRDVDNITPLHQATLSGSLEVCKLLVDHGADVRAKEVNDMTPLMFASVEGHVDIMNLFIKHAVIPELHLQELLEDVDNEDSNVLHLAVQNNMLEAVKVCLSNGISVNSQRENLQTALHIASTNGNVAIVDSLLQKDANIHAVDIDQMTPLHKAALFNRVDVAKLLIDKGASVNETDLEQYTPLLRAVWKDQSEMVTFLLDHGAKVMARDKFNRTCLHLAVNYNFIETIDQLLKRDEKELINAVDNMDWTPLHYAAKTGGIQVIDLLLEKGAKPTARDCEEKTPMHITAEHGHDVCVDRLFSASNAELNDGDIHGQSPLLLACIHGHLPAIKCILDLGGDITTRDDNRCTPVMLTASQGHAECMDYLIQCHADIDAVDKNKNTVLHHAVKEGSVSTTQVFLSHYSPPDFENTALHYAAESGGKDVTKGLLPYGVGNMKNNDYKTPLDIAVENGDTDVVSAILKHDSWKDAMSQRNAVGHSPMPMLIKKLPECALIVMDKCITYSSNDMSHQDLQVTFDYQWLDPNPDDSSVKQSRYFALNDMVEYGREELLSHPLAQHILFRKWRKFGRHYFYFEIVAYFLYLVSVCLWLVENNPITTSHLDASGCPIDDNLTFNATVLAALKSSGNTRASLGHDPLRYFTQIFITCFLGLSVIKELIRAINLKLKYFLDISTYSFWIMYACTLIFVLPLSYEPCLVQWQAGIIAVLLSWINIIFHIRGFEATGIYVSMFLQVTWSLLKSILVFSFLIIGFGLTYHILLAKEQVFSTAGLSMLKVLGMMLGELDFTSVYVSTDNEPFKEESYGVFVVFIFLMPIVLMNLMIGISVGDIDQIRQTAYMERLTLTVDLIYGIESTMPKFIQRKMYESKATVEPNAGSNTKWAMIKRRIFGSNRSTTPFVKQDDDDKFKAVHEKVDNYGKRLANVEKEMRKQFNLLTAIAEKMDVKMPKHQN